MMRAACTIVLALVAGCLAPSAPVEPDLARPSPPKPTVAAAPTPPQPVAAEVEISGTVTRPAHVSGEATIWIVDAPCWQTGARAFGESKTTADKFLVEVFVPQGTQLWVCAAIVEGNKPIGVYGQADRSPLYGKGTGEVTFPQLVVPLKKGKKVLPPGKR